LREINEQAQRGGAIIRALRDFVKRGVAHRERVQVNEVVREVVRLVEALARQNHILILLDLEELPEIDADRIQIAQVMMNLLQNAMDALCDAQEAERRVDITTRLIPAATVEVIVRDSGPGIAAEVAER